jgi:hypothetical protein
MQVHNRIARAFVAVTVAILFSLTALEVFVRLPIWLFGLSVPWELRSTNDHLTAGFVTLGAAFFALVTVPASMKVIYMALSPAPVSHVGEERT